MNKTLLILLALVVAMPSMALAEARWSGSVDDVWATTGNWSVAPDNEWDTEICGIRLDTYTTPATMPVIADGNDTSWGIGYVRGIGASITQTGGTHDWRNATAWRGLSIYQRAIVPPGTDPLNPALLHMTGGTQVLDTLGLGMDAYDTLPLTEDKGYGQVDIWGDSTMVIRQNNWRDTTTTAIGGPYSILILDGSLIDIRDDGELHMPYVPYDENDPTDPDYVYNADFISTIDSYITAGKIVAGNPGDSLHTAIVGDEYVVSVAKEYGDTDGDTDIDFDDFVNFSQGWFGPDGDDPQNPTPNAEWFYGDFDGDADVDFDDFVLFSGQSDPGGYGWFGPNGDGGGGTPVAVPEPAAMLLLCLGLSGLALIRRK